MLFQPLKYCMQLGPVHHSVAHCAFTDHSSLGTDVEPMEMNAGLGGLLQASSEKSVYLGVPAIHINPLSQLTKLARSQFRDKGISRTRAPCPDFVAAFHDPRPSC
jgi:hypothetical protein